MTFYQKKYPLSKFKSKVYLKTPIQIQAINKIGVIPAKLVGKIAKLLIKLNQMEIVALDIVIPRVSIAKKVKLSFAERLEVILEVYLNESII